jgi:outer membrane protein assembly factor BamB
VETLTCFDVSTGHPRWQFSNPTSYQCKTHYSSGPYSTPVMDDVRVYAWGTEGNLYCLARADGTLLWQRELWREFGVEPRGYFPPAGSPLLVGDRLIINLGAADAGAGIIALDKHDGRTLWTATKHRAGCATPCAATIHGRSFAFVFTADGLVELDPQTGREYWQIAFRANNPELVNATSPIVYQDIVFVSGYSLGSLCIQVQPDGSYQELWRDKRRNLDSQYNPVICIDGWVYGFAALDDTLRCIKLRTGELAWKGLRELERGAAIAVGQQLIVLGTRGHLASVRIDPRRLNVLSQPKEPVLAAPAYSFPALHRGRLLIRNEAELVCFDLRALKATSTSP